VTLPCRGCAPIAARGPARPFALRNLREERPVNIGERIRKVRQAKNLSLQQVAQKTSLSSATLSRIETSKQSLDLEVFLQLATVLEFSPAQLLDEAEHDGDGAEGANMIDRLEPRDRLRMWRDLATNTKTKKTSLTMRRAQIRAMALDAEELIAQLEFLREQIEYLRKRLRNC
jgi:transcriptional regulator with XRE-family HTH domain